jgi:23S rRNA pseudouridine1911/1915/1917 synthase
MSAPAILFEDNHLLVLNKPSGLATMGALEGEPSLVEWARADLKRRYNKPGNVYVGVVQRLDAWASGVLVLAKTSKAAARLTAQFAARETSKVYWCVVEGLVEPANGTWHDHLAKDDAAHRVRSVTKSAPGAQAATLNYHVRGSSADRQMTWLQVELLTGRKHQIRVQCSSRGYAIIGDQKYDATTRLAPETIALHSRTLSFEHPTRGERLTFTAPLPGSWRKLNLDWPNDAFQNK